MRDSGNSSASPSGGDEGRVPPPGDDDMVGRVIDDRYRLLSFISQGGMGSVYLAEHTTIQQSIAVKVLHPDMARVPDLVTRFEREAFAIGRIDHPNCIRVSDFGRLEDGALFLVMEYLDGKSLAEVIDSGGPMPVARALHILRHILRGLAHVHQAGIVHRDIKPENIVLVTQDGDGDFAKILDFGIAKLVGDARPADHHDLTQAGIAFGTPTYMSPEQTLGEVIDHRSDLYQATLIFYELLAGRPPFRSDDKIELMSMHASRRPPDVTEFHPDADIPAPVGAILERGLAKRARDRFGSASEYLEAVDAALVDLGVTPWPRLETAASAIRPATGANGPAEPSARKGPPQPHRRNLRRFIGVGAAVLAVTIIALVMAGRRDSLPTGDERDRAMSSLAQRAEEALERGEPREALQLLTARGVDISHDADALLVLGHVYSAKNLADKARDAYRKAVQLDASLKVDPTMRANLTVQLGDKETFAEAAKMLIGELLDSDARADVIAKAVREGDGAFRHLALDVATELDFVGDLDLRRLYELDLVEGARCRNRRAAVAKLRALGDPAAIPALKEAERRLGTTGRWRGVNLNGCLVDDAEKAIQYLSTLADDR